MPSSFPVPKVPADLDKIGLLIFKSKAKHALIARELGIDKTTFSKQLKGTRPIDLLDLVRLAGWLGVEWESLLLKQCACGHVICPQHAAEKPDQQAEQVAA